MQPRHEEAGDDTPARPAPPARPEPDPAWTVEQACAYFAEGGLPVEPARLERIIFELRKQSGGREWNPVGRGPSPGPQGGVGKALYPVADLMRLHAALAPWLAVQGPAGDTPGADPDLHLPVRLGKLPPGSILPRTPLGPLRPVQAPPSPPAGPARSRAVRRRSTRAVRHRITRRGAHRYHRQRLTTPPTLTREAPVQLDAAVLLDAHQDWYCPQCGLEQRVSPPLPPNAARMHTCPELHMITAPLVPAGTDCRLVAVERQDYLGAEIQETGDDGKPYMAVRTEYADGHNDTAVHAPLARWSIT